MLRTSVLRMPGLYGYVLLFLIINKISDFTKYVMKDAQLGLNPNGTKAPVILSYSIPNPTSSSIPPVYFGCLWQNPVMKVVGFFTLLLLLPSVYLAFYIERRLPVTKTRHLELRVPRPRRTHNLLNLDLAFALGLALACLLQSRCKIAIGMLHGLL